MWRGDDKGGFISLVGDRLPKGLADVLAVQSLFPTVTGDELIGVVDNDIKTASEIGEARRVGRRWSKEFRICRDMLRS